MISDAQDLGGIRDQRASALLLLERRCKATTCGAICFRRDSLGATAPAHTFDAQFVTTCFDTNGARFWPETESTRDTVLQQAHMRVLKLHHLLAVEANEVVVVRMINKVRIIVSLITSKVDFLQQSTFHQQSKSAVKGRAGRCRINFPRTFPQFICRKMVRGVKSSLDDDFPLPGVAETLGGDEFFDPCLDGRAEGRGHGRK